MANRQPRLGSSIKDFHNDIVSTNEYIMLPCPPPVGMTNGIRIGWTTGQITYWNDVLGEWTPLISKYLNKSGERTKDVTDQLKIIIKRTRTYERTNHLYDTIAVCPAAVNKDFEIFHILRSTSLASTSHARSAEPGTKTVVIVLKKSGFLMHQLLVTTPDHKGRAKEEGVKEILIYKAIAPITEVAPALSLFQYVGDVSRGLIKVTHDDTTQGMRAWYIARVKNSRGELGDACESVGFIIV